MPNYLKVFAYYTLFTTSILGVIIVYFFDFSFNRLTGISDEVKSLVFFHVIYSALILYLTIFLSARIYLKNNNKYYRIFYNESPYKYKRLAIFLLFLNLFYLISISVTYTTSIPLYSVWSGENLSHSLALAQEAHFGTNPYNLPYISKFFDFSVLFTSLLILLLYLRGNISFNFLFLAYINAFVYLSLDLQKSPFLILCLMSIFLSFQFSYNKRTLLLRVIYSLIIACIALYFYSFFMNKSFTGMLLYIFNRPVFGQIQGMYYIYEYYPPSTDTMFSKFYFNSSSTHTTLPPDRYIASIVYPGNKNIVNVNTFFIGEAWGFGKNTGVFLSAWAVSLSIFLYISFWSYVFRFYTHLTYIMAIIFFSTLPINTSLQFIIYQKYFLYFIIFFMLPLLFIILLLSLVKINDN